MAQKLSFLRFEIVNPPRAQLRISHCDLNPPMSAIRKDYALFAIRFSR